MAWSVPSPSGLRRRTLLRWLRMMRTVVVSARGRWRGSAGEEEVHVQAKQQKARQGSGAVGVQCGCSGHTRSTHAECSDRKSTRLNSSH